MLLIVGLGIFINNTWSQSSVLGSKSDFSVTTLLSSTNAERLKKNQPALSLDPQLTAAAQAKAEDMARHDYWSHDSPDGKTPWTFISAAGYQYQKAGENLAYGFSNASESVAGWMGSPEHRANILDPSYKNVGFGVVHSPDYLNDGPQTIIVAEYGLPATDGTNIAASTTGTPATGSVLNASSAETAGQPVSRIQVLTGDKSQIPLLIIVALSGGAMALFLLRYGYRLHRLLNRGEAFVVHHPYVDIAIVFLITTGVLLTRSSGIIR